MSQITPVPPTTTTQALGSLIKSCRDLMRKDKGLSTDLDRLPMLTWILFLKFLDDLEQVREAEAAMEGKRYRPAIEAPYRWRDWAAKADGMTGDSLTAFIAQQDDAPLPDGTKGAGLFAYLRSLRGSNGGDRRDVIRSVFQGTVNRMLNGYLLRDVLNKVNAIHFTSTDEIYTLGHLYESMLKEMRDAAGENGEFYTPRPLVKFIVTVVDPRLGEIILDPAVGTGGFLAEAFEHLKKQCKTAEDHRRLQRETLLGIEAKPLPYLLCQMNLLLHGIETPSIDPLNALRFPLREIGDKDRVDIILSNPPFGGEEERGILSNFPEDKKISETALLFLQLIMRKLRRQPKPGRAAVVVPNRTLFGDGVCARIKEELLKEFNLHTIIRLPKGVFSPYTDIETNVIFFDRTGPTKEVWYYENPLPPGRKKYTKTQPIQFAEFSDCITWWNDRKENEQAWRIEASKLIEAGCNLDVRNPHAKDDISHQPPRVLAQLISNKAEQVFKLMGRFVDAVSERTTAEPWPMVRLERVLKHRKAYVTIDDLKTYRRPRVQLHAQGVVLRDEILGAAIKTKSQQVCKAGDFLVAEIDAKVGGFGIVPEHLDGAIVSSHYFLFEIDLSQLDRRFLDFFIRTPTFREQVEAQGSTNYAAIRPAHVLGYEIALPPVDEQRRVVEMLAGVEEAKRLCADAALELNAILPAVFFSTLKGESDASGPALH